MRYAELLRSYRSRAHAFDDLVFLGYVLCFGSVFGVDLQKTAFAEAFASRLRSRVGRGCLNFRRRGESREIFARDPAFVRSFCEMPLVFCILLLLVCVGYTSFAFVREQYEHSRKLSRASVKESLDQLPTGLCFYRQNGRTVLVNDSMYALCYELTEKNLQNAALFWQTLSCGEVPSGIERLESGDRPSFRFRDGRVWTFSREDLGDIVQLVAADTTELSNINAELKLRNAELAAVNARLREYGERVDVVNVPAGDFAGCDWVIGGYDAIVDNFEVKTNCHDDNGGNAAAPRTFVGMKEDGTIFVCVVDGRGAGGSVGLTVEEEAQLAGALGAQYALELDGGGSSTMIVRINDELTLRNVPSDGSMRRVANVVLLVEKPKAEEDPGQDGPGEDGPGTEPGGDNPGVENPGGEKPSTNPIIAFFQSIIDAIIKFFTELFS